MGCRQPPLSKRNVKMSNSVKKLPVTNDDKASEHSGCTDL